MKSENFVELKQQVNACSDAEGDIHDQLVAIDMIGNLNQEMFDPGIEKFMTVRAATEIIAKIDHKELDKVNCDYQVVYDDLHDRYRLTIENTDKAIQRVHRAGNTIRLDAIAWINVRIDDLNDRGVKNELLIENLREVVDFLQTGVNKK